MALTIRIELCHHLTIDYAVCHRNVLSLLLHLPPQFPVRLRIPYRYRRPRIPSCHLSNHDWHLFRRNLSNRVILHYFRCTRTRCCHGRRSHHHHSIPDQTPKYVRSTHNLPSNRHPRRTCSRRQTKQSITDTNPSVTPETPPPPKLEKLPFETPEAQAAEQADVEEEEAVQSGSRWSRSNIAGNIKRMNEKINISIPGLKKRTKSED